MRGHIRKRGGSYAIVLDNGRDPTTGRRKQKWLSGYATKRAAEEALVDLLGKQKRGERIDPDLTPLAAHVTAWLAARDDLAPLSVTQYGSVIRNHIDESDLGRMPLGKIRRSHIRTFEQELVRKGLATSTRNVVAAVLSRSFSDAIEDDLISANPFAGRRRTNERRKDAKFTVWTSEELKAFLAAADGRLAAVWRLAVATGARRGELLAATWLGFSAADRTWTVSQQLVPTRGGATIAPCKTRGSNRTIRLDQETVDALERHRERQLVERDVAGDAYQDHDLIFADEIGRPIFPNRLSELFHETRAASGIRPGRLHDIRHSHATHLLSAGVQPHLVAQRLGHSSPSITLNVYAHVLPRDDQRAAETMARVLR